MDRLPDGLYEQLINQNVQNQLDALAKEDVHVLTSGLAPEEAAVFLSRYTARVVRYALQEVRSADRPNRQVEIINRILTTLQQELPNALIEEEMLCADAQLLQAVFEKENFSYPDPREHLESALPRTRLSQSELFTGSHAGISLESELKKEIASADELHWLVSFIKFSGLRLIRHELEEFAHTPRQAHPNLDHRIHGCD